MAKIKPLRKSPLFADFSPRDIACLCQAVDEVSLTDGQEISAESSGLILVAAGRLQVSFALSANGKKGAVAHLLLGPDQYFGELSLLTGSATSLERRPLKIVAQGECKILLILPEKFFKVAYQEPQLGFKVIQAISKNLQKKIFCHHALFQKVLQQSRLLQPKE